METKSKRSAPAIDWRIRNAVRYLRAEGALSVSLAIPSQPGTIVYRNNKVKRATKGSRDI